MPAGTRRPGRFRGLPTAAALFFAALLWTGLAAAQTGNHEAFWRDVDFFASLADRSTGTEGARAAADHIIETFDSLGFEETGRQRFRLPVLHVADASITIEATGLAETIHPLRYNVISPQTVPAPGLKAPVYYVGRGGAELNGRPLEGAIALMELSSGKDWLKVASLGARAVIFVDRGGSPRSLFTDKEELTPFHFPAFWMPLSQARRLFGDFESLDRAAGQATIVSPAAWEEETAENLWCMIPGRDETLAEQPLMVEAFYDSRALVPGYAPGADEALSAAVLLELARALKAAPPRRSVLLLATAGHAEGLAGMREAMHALRSSSRELRKWKKEFVELADRAKGLTVALDAFIKDGTVTLSGDYTLQAAMEDRIKTEVDRVSRDLMKLRAGPVPGQGGHPRSGGAKAVSAPARLAQRFQEPNGRGESHAGGIGPPGAPRPKGHAGRGQAADRGRGRRAPVPQPDQRRGPGRGRLPAPVQPRIRHRRVQPGLDARIVAGNQPDRRVQPDRRRAESRGRGCGTGDRRKRHVPGHPAAEPAAQLAKLVSGPTVPGRRTERPVRIPGAVPGHGGRRAAELGHGRRTRYGTWGAGYAEKQADLVVGLLRRVAEEESLSTGREIRNGLSMVAGRAKFIRHGELFPDQPAPGTVILAYQGPAMYHAMVDATGAFLLKGMADKRHVVDKVILEAYRFDPETGEVVWAVDKEQTGKDAYRVRMQRRAMETDLVMFGCRGITIFNLLDPRSFQYLTQINLLDGRLEAPPLRYWWSRIDTRESTIASLYLEPGTRMKLTLTDSVLTKKLILLNASPENPQGTGYPVGEKPIIGRTELAVAKDMWNLLGPRMRDLETHGIHDEKIQTLKAEGLAALARAEEAFGSLAYDEGFEQASRSWALADRVYDTVEKTQKDVLFGVLFYIALFVPFAFCLERLLFAYADINKRIVAFLAVLIGLIAVIYNVHPAFQLAYSPMVVILAFFIMGLSLIVTLIIFFRFEAEMERLQKRSNQQMAPEISRWQAFVAAFLLGVSNLRRRRLRTALTCTTLVILTFTIMSFTSVSSLRHRARLHYMDQAPYRGIMLKNVNWHGLPEESLYTLRSAFRDVGVTAPRAWLQNPDKTQPRFVAVEREGRLINARGLVGLSAVEPTVSGLDKLLVGGRWFRPGETRAVLLPERIAVELGVDPEHPSGEVLLWGVPHLVAGVFSGQGMDRWTDLDGEPPTPVVFPHEVAYELSETELEAMESGQEEQHLNSRYQHVDGDLTLILPFDEVMAQGGSLKSVAVLPNAGISTDEVSGDLVDRFKLTIFVGEPDGTYLYHASDALSYSGVPNILIPLLISVFIVLNTMIGSVYERKTGNRHLHQRGPGAVPCRVPVHRRIHGLRGAQRGDGVPGGPGRGLLFLRHRPLVRHHGELLLPGRRGGHGPGLLRGPDFRDLPGPGGGLHRHSGREPRLDPAGGQGQHAEHHPAHFAQIQGGPGGGRVFVPVFPRPPGRVPRVVLHRGDPVSVRMPGPVPTRPAGTGMPGGCLRDRRLSAFPHPGMAGAL